MTLRESFGPTSRCRYEEGRPLHQRVRDKSVHRSARPHLGRELRRGRLRHRRRDERAGAHDQRDFEFAKQYGLPIKTVIAPADGSAALDPTAQGAFTEDGVLVDSGPYTGLNSLADARAKMTTDAATSGFAKCTIQFKWATGFSRQRYWGHPDPDCVLREVRSGAQGYPGA